MMALIILHLIFEKNCELQSPKMQKSNQYPQMSIVDLED